MVDESAKSASQLHPDLLVCIFASLCANLNSIDEFEPTSLEVLPFYAAFPKFAGTGEFWFFPSALRYGHAT
jgi:hypothetical protein